MGLFHFLFLFFNAAGVGPSSSIKSWSQQYHYFDGDAHDLNVQASIKDKFYQLLISPYVPPFFCRFTPNACRISSFLLGLKVNLKSCQPYNH